VDTLIEKTEEAALEVLLHNIHGPYRGLPSAAAWGYPEPYTRDLLISALGTLVAGNQKLMDALRKVLETLSKNQSTLGHIPSLVHDPEDRGASDTTPLFLFITALYRMVTSERMFLESAVSKALRWMEYQSPSDRVIVAQLPTSDWRDEQWVWGYGLYVNTIVYSYLRLFGQHERAAALRDQMDRFTIRGGVQHRHVHEGLVLRYKPYYALWSYKIYSSERFDLLGNSIAMLSGIASYGRTGHLVAWIERECEMLRQRRDLGVNLPPSLFPYIQPTDPDWKVRYAEYNKPGEYHNGGVWPFICGFYIAALVGAGRHSLAKKKLSALAQLVQRSKRPGLDFGFNEWHRAQDGMPQGHDWQTWSAALFLYAARCVADGSTPFFDMMRGHGNTR
jgi:hypothetical protein